MGEFWIVALGSAAVLCAAAAGVAVLIGWKLTHPARRALTQSPEQFGLVCEPMRFPSREGGVQLSGWLLPPTGAARLTIVFAHGYAGNRLERGLPALALAKSLVEAGCRVLMFDFRNSGESEGRLTTVGQLEQFDVLGAVDWAAQRYAEPIGLLGFSMGGTASLLAAARDPRVLAVVADSAFSRLKPYLRRNLSVWSKLPRYPFTPLIMAILPLLTGVRPDEVDALAAVERLYPRPALFIHSEADQAIPAANSRELQAAHPDRFRLWTTPTGGHVGSYAQQPEAYTEQVLRFFADAAADFIK
ncbi:alpha/beta fold hydrolase [Paenibacillus athensensis]|uniref:alpha/beta hydrolase n=1 Tax=Paenibacillus athensensis TaxID=1967502 RepID=UPI001430613E|nr:alpha/beta fold hydrolase [Paenibacillus athensensis]MCD1257976.1 alpha/beta fold hydrolase [Paenibacillus athensensis]